MIFNILGLLLFGYTYYFMKKVVTNTTTDAPLTNNEKIQVIITILLGFPITWFIYKMGWDKKLPIKAKQINTYGRNMILALLGIAVVAIIIAVLATKKS